MDEKIRQQTSFKDNCVQVSNTDSSRCCKTWSLANYVTLLTNRTSCLQLTNEDIEALSDLLHMCYKHYDMLSLCLQGGRITGGNQQCRQVPPECLDNNSMYYIFNYITDMKFMRKARHGHTIHLTYAMSFIPLAVGKSTEQLYQAMSSEISLSHGGVHITAVNFGLKQLMFEEYLKLDSVWFGLALTAVIVIVWLYTTSIFITIMTMSSIIVTIVISYFIYSILFGIGFFPYMNLMAVVLLIGVGVDDVFLYCRIWSLAKLEKNIGTLEKVISDTLKNATLSMFVTSATTAGALYANIISNITALRCFAVFGGTVIVVNFLLMITWIPATIVLHDKWCSCCCKNPEYASRKGLYHHTCKWLHKLYARILEYSRTFFEKLLPYAIVKLRYLWLTVFGLLSVLSIICVLYYPTLKLPSSNEFQMFAQSHPFEVYDFKVKDQFWFEKAAGTSKATVPLTVVWGIEPTDTGSKYDPYSKTRLEYYNDFSINTLVEGQNYFLKFCRDLRSSEWYQNDIGPQSMKVNCFIEGFRNFMERPCRSPIGSFEPCCEVSKFPFTRQVFTKCLDEWMSGLEKSRHIYYIHPNAGPRFSKDTGEIVAVIAEFNSKQPYSFNFESMKEFYDSMDEWVSSQTSWAPKGFKQGWFVSDLSFFDLQQSIAGGTPIAMAVSIAIATILAFVTTLNVLITIWAMLTITGTIFTVVGVLVLMGWELNIMESVTITVAVGLAIDFTLHYGMAYKLSPGFSREAQVLCATQKVGSVVTTAAISTILAGLFMLPSTVAAYRQLGIFLIIIMSFSWLYATFSFQSLLLLFGPIDNFGQLHWPTIHCDTCVEQEHIDKTVYTVSDSLSSSSTNNTHHQGNCSSEIHELEALTEDDQQRQQQQQRKVSKHNNISHSHSTSITTMNGDIRTLESLNDDQNSQEIEDETTVCLLHKNRDPVALGLPLHDDSNPRNAVENSRMLLSNDIGGNKSGAIQVVMAEVENEGDVALNDSLELQKDDHYLHNAALEKSKQNGSNNNIWVKNEIFV